MTSVDSSKIPRNYSAGKCTSPGVSIMSMDGSDASMNPHDIPMRRNAYMNSPSMSSSSSTSTSDFPFKYRRRKFRDSYRAPSISKRRYRYDKLFHLTHSLNRQYVIAMTNILFQMQKEIYKLKKRTCYVEHKLAKQKSCSHPVIRIPRLTQSEISTIYVQDSEKQQNNVSRISEENANNIELEQNIIKHSAPQAEYDIDNQNVETMADTNERQDSKIHRRKQLHPKTKYCSRCQHEFSHRSAYLRHMRRIHQGLYNIIPDTQAASESVNIAPEVNASISDQSMGGSDAENGIDQGIMQRLVNPWDIGEGRLRPRPVSKQNHGPINKIKCEICNKFFRAEYITKHKRRTHHIPEKSSTKTLNNDCDQMQSNITETTDEIQAVASEPSPDNTEPSSTITVAEVDADEIPILLPKDMVKPIVITVTCLDRSQLSIVEEFVKKFSSRVSQTTTIDSHTTHLITNDDKRTLRSPLSMKFIEAIANHCFCVSYRWILDCLKYDRIIEESSYEIEGDDTDYHSYGGPKRSRLADKNCILFENTCFMIKCTESDEMKMPNDRLQNLIKTCGGTIITSVTQSLLDKYDIVVLCDKLYVSERRHNYDQCRALGIHFVSSDWVLESILEYRRKNFLQYEETP